MNTNIQVKHTFLHIPRTTNPPVRAGLVEIQIQSSRS